MLAIFAYMQKFSLKRDVLLVSLVILVGATFVSPILKEIPLISYMLAIASGLSLGILLFAWFNTLSSKQESDIASVLMYAFPVLVFSVPILAIVPHKFFTFIFAGIIAANGIILLHVDPQLSSNLFDGELTLGKIKEIPFFGIALFVVCDVMTTILYGVASNTILHSISSASYILSVGIFFAIGAITFFIFKRHNDWVESIWIPPFLLVLASLVFACLSGDKSHTILAGLLFGSVTTFNFLRWIILPAMLSYFNEYFNTPRIFFGAILLLITNSFLFVNLGAAFSTLVPQNATNLGNIAGIMSIILVLIFSGTLLVFGKHSVKTHSQNRDGLDNGNALPDYNDEPLENFKKICASYNLTARETEVALLTAQGFASTYIANELVVTSSTVRFHQQNIYRKMEIHSRQELIEIYQQTHHNMKP